MSVPNTTSERLCEKCGLAIMPLAQRGDMRISIQGLTSALYVMHITPAHVHSGVRLQLSRNEWELLGFGFDRDAGESVCPKNGLVTEYKGEETGPLDRAHAAAIEATRRGQSIATDHRREQ